MRIREIRNRKSVEIKCYHRIAGKTRRDRMQIERIRDWLKQRSIEERLQKKIITKIVWTFGAYGGREKT